MKMTPQTLKKKVTKLRNFLCHTFLWLANQKTSPVQKKWKKWLENPRTTGKRCASNKNIKLAKFKKNKRECLIFIFSQIKSLTRYIETPKDTISETMSPLISKGTKHEHTWQQINIDGFLEAAAFGFTATVEDDKYSTDEIYKSIPEDWKNLKKWFFYGEIYE